MARYFFNLSDHTIIEDPEGIELPDQLDAHAVAQRIADRLLEEKPNFAMMGMEICVSNTEGHELFRVPVTSIH